MPINAVLDIKEEYPLYGYTEPVTLQEVKDYCKIDFDEDDTLLTLLITAARENLEKYLGVSIVQKNLTVIVNNEDGGIEIPYGPTPDAIDVTTILDIDGNAIETQWILITGNDFKQLQLPCWPLIQMSYTARYVPVWQSLTEGGVVLPQAIKFAIMAQVFFNYDNRGEAGNVGRGYVNTFVCDAAKQLCNKYKRNTELSL